MKLAAIDIGSNAARLLITEVLNDEFYENIDSPKTVKRVFHEQGLKNMEAGGVQIKGYN